MSTDSAYSGSPRFPAAAGAAIGAALCIALAAQPLSAHGGAYRGPTGGTGPSSRGGVPPPPRGPNTSQFPGPNELGTSWQYWWELNKEPYLRRRRALAARAAEAAAGGSTGLAANQTASAPTDAEARALILPALRTLLDRTSNRDVATASMIALAKIGADHEDVKILPIFRAHLRRKNAEIRETAALCMGLSARRDALDDLCALALDDRAGRKLMDRDSVDDRTRAFAGYALGLLARARADADVKRRVLEVLSDIVRDRGEKDRDVRVAAIHALGLLNPDHGDARQKRLRWKALDVLRELWTREVSEQQHQIVQAHVPAAVARLLGRGSSAEHRQFERLFADELRATGERRRHRTIVQSAAIGLGKLCEPVETDPDAGPHSEQLLEYALEGADPQAQRFALIALGEIGGDRNRTELLKYFARAHRLTMKPWAGIALGVLAWHRREADGEVDATIGQALRSAIFDVRSEDSEAALAVAIGLCGFADATKDLRKLLKKRFQRDLVAGYACTGLALIPAPEARADVLRVFDRADRRPVLFAQTAVALVELGDRDVVDRLLGVLKNESRSVATLSAAAAAFRVAGDSRAVAPLCELLLSDGLTDTARAFVAASLGGIAEKGELPWSHPLTVGTNYHALVDTLSSAANGVLDIL